MVALLSICGLGFLLIPPLVDQVREFIDALPAIVADLTAGRGRLGFLERDYQVVERLREAIDKAGTGGVTGLTGPAVEILTRILTGVVGALTIAFLTFFMLLEGPHTVDHLLGLLPERVRPRWERVSGNIYRTIAAYVSQILAGRLIAGS